MHVSHKQTTTINSFFRLLSLEQRAFEKIMPLLYPPGMHDCMSANRKYPHGRVVKVADFSALNHSIISPLWVRASLGARVKCGTSQVLLAGVSGGFSPGTPVFAPPTD